MDIPVVPIVGVPDPLPEGLVVLDVRERVEWDHGHIEGAVHVPLAQLPRLVGEGRLGDLAQEQTLVVCKVGARSAQAVAYLTQQGVDAVNLDGGLLEWEAADRPLVSETGQPPRVV